MVTGGLGKVYGDGEEIVRQGEVGDCMYVIQTGQAEAIQGKDGKAVRLAVHLSVVAVASTVTKSAAMAEDDRADGASSEAADAASASTADAEE